MLDSRTVQIVLGDLQSGIAEASRTNPPAALRRSVGVLATVAGVLEIPITVSLAPGSGVIEEIPADVPVLVRTGPCVWDDEAARKVITAAERPVIALAGVTSEIVVLRTAIDALAAGYAVHVLVDACGGLTDRTEAAAFRQIEAAGGIVTSVAGFASDMVRNFTTPKGREIITALHGLAA
ncbi:isochorismatase family protein [Nonomuraea sediminis]|uniref:isochorismatase family protein n=1 Tax=Nonomuraea sediminis TaxID=2835864 RepID=UPI001BDCE902|nr:isochorismatase family protein [Nonomuraea sediminis]